MHARYLLTEYGGVKVDSGFGEVDDDTTIVSILDSSLAESERDKYSDTARVFNRICAIKIASDGSTSLLG